MKKRKEKTNLTDLQDGDIIRDLLQGLNKVSSECAIAVFNTEANLAAFEGGDVDIAGGSRGGSRRLEHGGGEGGSVGNLVEFLGAEVIDEHVEGENISEGVDRELLGDQRSHGGIVEGEDGDGEPPVDVSGEVGEGEVVVEG